MGIKELVIDTAIKGHLEAPAESEEAPKTYTLTASDISDLVKANPRPRRRRIYRSAEETEVTADLYETLKNRGVIGIPVRNESTTNKDVQTADGTISEVKACPKTGCNSPTVMVELHDQRNAAFCPKCRTVQPLDY